MELINKIRKSRKGFTLVEIIVVLVILAVLAAFMIPSMIGFINEAKKKAAIAEQREIYIAAQAISTEYFGKYGAGSTTKDAPAKLAIASATGVAGNLGSATVDDVIAANKLSDTAAKATALEAIPDATKAMANYLDNDIIAGDGATTGSLWTVVINDKGIVTKVTYQKEGVKLDDLEPSASMN
jgi:type IV pilus assembly protein PilA